MSLQEQLDVLREQQISSTPEPVLQIGAAAIDYLRTTGMASASLKVGDDAPDFTLSSVKGDEFTLSRLLDQGPVILDFFRGGWCPFCSLELRAYQQLIENIENAGASLVAISPELPQLIAESVETNEITFPVLTDGGNAVARKYGLVYKVPEALRSVYEGFGLDLPARTNSPTAELPVPATYLVDRSGKIRRSFVDVDHSRRGEPQEFVDELRDLATTG